MNLDDFFTKIFTLYIRSIGGKEPQSWPYALVDKLRELNPRINGTWQNITLCTLYRSCSELTGYKHPNSHCKDCTLVYNHCPWVAEPQKNRKTEDNASSITNFSNSLIYLRLGFHIFFYFFLSNILVLR